MYRTSSSAYLTKELDRFRCLSEFGVRLPEGRVHVRVRGRRNLPLIDNPLEPFNCLAVGASARGGYTKSDAGAGVRVGVAALGCLGEDCAKTPLSLAELAEPQLKLGFGEFTFDLLRCGEHGARLQVLRTDTEAAPEQPERFPRGSALTALDSADVRVADPGTADIAL
jgi:hypothetical protein